MLTCLQEYVCQGITPISLAILRPLKILSCSSGPYPSSSGWLYLVELYNSLPCSVTNIVLKQGCFSSFPLQCCSLGYLNRNYSLYPENGTSFSSYPCDVRDFRSRYLRTFWEQVWQSFRAWLYDYHLRGLQILYLNLYRTTVSKWSLYFRDFWIHKEMGFTKIITVLLVVPFEKWWFQVKCNWSPSLGWSSDTELRLWVFWIVHWRWR